MEFEFDASSRYPKLVRLPDKTDVLTEIIRPRVGSDEPARKKSLPLKIR